MMRNPISLLVPTRPSLTGLVGSATIAFLTWVVADPEFEMKGNDNTTSLDRGLAAGFLSFLAVLQFAPFVEAAARTIRRRDPALSGQPNLAALATAVITGTFTVLFAIDDDDVASGEITRAQKVSWTSLCAFVTGVLLKPFADAGINRLRRD